MKRVLKGTMVSLVLGLTLFSRGVDVKAEDNVKRFVTPDDVTEIPANYFTDLQDVEFCNEVPNSFLYNCNKKNGCNGQNSAVGGTWKKYK